MLNPVDDVARECPAAFPASSASGRRVAQELTGVIERRATSGTIVRSNAPE